MSGYWYRQDTGQHTVCNFCFYDFSICLVSFCIVYYCCESIILSCEFTLSKGKKTLRKRCFYSYSDTCLFRFPYTYRYMQITLHLAVFAGDKNISFDFSDAWRFGHPVYFDYQDFLGFTSDLSFQSFNAGKLSEML